MVVMASRHNGLRVDVNTQAGAETGRFQIVGGKGVSCKERVAEAVFDEFRHGIRPLSIEAVRQRPESRDILRRARGDHVLRGGRTTYGLRVRPGIPGGELEDVRLVAGR